MNFHNRLNVHGQWCRLLPVFLALIASLGYCQTGVSHWNVCETGARPGGQEDCTAVFQKLLDEAGQAGGGVVEVPAGQYRINGVLSVPANVTLQGIYRVPPTSQRGVITNLTGSVLFAYAGRGSRDGAPFIRLSGNNAAIAGLIIAYPEWKQTDVPPVPYPPCVLSENTENVGVSECLLLNPYEGIKLVLAHRHIIRNVTGYPIVRGIYVDQCMDIGHIENVHFWPFGVHYKPEDPYCKWVNTQGVAFEFARTDWHYVQNTFCFGYGIGYKFSESKHGSANGNFLGIGADSCQRAVVVDQAQAPGLLISNGEFVGRWGSTNSVCMEISPQAEGKVSLVNCSFWGPIDLCVWMRSPVAQFTASACNFVNWDCRNAGSPAIQLDAGRAIVQGCTFGEERLCVRVGSNVVSAILTANQAIGGFIADNQAGGHAQIALNEKETPFIWTPEMSSHYRIRVGVGDRHYLRNWHGREGATDKQWRWSTADSQLVLPVSPNEPYKLLLDADVPPPALSAEAGIYLEGKRLAPLKAGSGMITIEIPATAQKQLTLEVRVNGWVPQKLNADSHDPRTLGIQIRALTMKAAKAGPSVFDVITGECLVQ
jgi:hypothetical protein